MAELEDLVAVQVARLRRVGSDTAAIEVKAAGQGLPKTVVESVSAFANASGGTVILGLSEEDGFKPVPGFNAKRIRDALSRACSDDLEPPVRTDVEIVAFDGALVVYMEVPGGDPLLGPYYVKNRGAYGGSYIRSGDGDRKLTSYEVTQLLGNRGQPTDDASLIGDATYDDLDSGLVDALLKRLRARPSRAFKDVDEAHALLRAGVGKFDEAGVFRPTLAGLLCLGSYPQQFLPQLYVSFVALPGRTIGDALDDGTRFLDNVTCDGTIPQMLDAVLSAARRNMRTAAVIHGLGREDRYDYPVEVIRELVANALLHRDYSPGARGTHVQVELFPDRLVVKSPGGLYGAVVPGQLGIEEVSSTRNTYLARLLAEIPDEQGMPVSENRGSGLPAVMTRLRKAGMSPPEFDIAPGHVHVTVPQHALLDPETMEWISELGGGALSNEQHIALALMRETGSVSNEMLRAWGVESHLATNALRGLVDRRLAVKLGGRRYATYELMDDPDRELDLFGLGLSKPVGRPHQPRRDRIDSELQAVIEAIRAGHTTVKEISLQLGLSYTTATRRVNSLLVDGRIRATSAAHSRDRTFTIL